DHDRTRHLRHADARSAARRQTRRARRRRRVSQKARLSRRVRLVSPCHRRERLSQRRNDPPRRFPPHAAEVVGSASHMGGAMTRIGWVLVMTLAACTIGEGGNPRPSTPADKHASATIAPTTGNTVAGTAQFTYSGDEDRVSLLVMVQNAPEGMHGFH